MGTNNFIDRNQIANSRKILPSHIFQLMNALVGTIVGRGTAGTPVSGQDIGTPVNPFGTGYFNELNIGGESVDFSVVNSAPNRIVSGRTSTESSQPQFFSIAADGSSLTILGRETSLNLVINKTAVTIDQDITVTSLRTVTNPLTFNTAVQTSIYEKPVASDRPGEIDELFSESLPPGELSIPAASLNAWITLRRQVGNVSSYGFMFNLGGKGYYAKWRYFFDHNGGGILSSEMDLTSAITLTLMNTGWVFVDADNLPNPDISYLSPVTSESEPTSPSTGQYWYRPSTQRWSRYNGTDFVLVNRIPIGIIVVDETGVKAYRCFDFGRNFEALNETTWRRSGVEGYVLSKASEISVYGKRVNAQPGLAFRPGDAALITPTADQIANRTRFYLYLTEDLETRASVISPLYREDLRGYYHPFETWLCVCEAMRDTGTATAFVDNFNYNPYQKYNLSEDFPLEFSARGFYTRDTGLILGHRTNPYPGVPPITSITLDRRTDTGRWVIEFSPDYFTEVPVAVGQSQNSRTHTPDNISNDDETVITFVEVSTARIRFRISILRAFFQGVSPFVSNHTPFHVKFSVSELQKARYEHWNNIKFRS